MFPIPGMYVSNICASIQGSVSRNLFTSNPVYVVSIIYEHLVWQVQSFLFRKFGWELFQGMKNMSKYSIPSSDAVVQLIYQSSDIMHYKLYCHKKHAAIISISVSIAPVHRSYHTCLH